MTTTNINAAPCYNMHLNRWDNVDGEPSDFLPEGPIELYEPTEPGTEDMDSDANFDVEFRGKFSDMMAAINEIRGEMGRFMWSRPDSGHYLGFLNHCSGSVALIEY